MYFGDILINFDPLSICPHCGNPVPIVVLPKCDLCVNAHHMGHLRWLLLMTSTTKKTEIQLFSYQVPLQSFLLSTETIKSMYFTPIVA